MRSWLRQNLFAFVRRLLATDDGHEILAKSLPGRLPGGLAFCPGEDLLCELPYPDLPRSIESPADGTDAIFITGRFRSGSTLLWNVFRHVPGCTSYYEPLNERRWFDPLTRGQSTDRTHVGVENYWREYEGLGDLADYYREDWIRRDLFMPATCWQPGLRRYIELLLKHAPGRAVLQFNRVDFRLPWLRAQFPKAKFVHLYRHPRDQWLSTLHGGPHFPLNGAARDFEPEDKFYLLMWSRDLRHHFPFLDVQGVDHPYELFYLIWKLSYLFGRRYADISLAYEHLVSDTSHELTRLFDVLEIHSTIDESLLTLFAPSKVGRWTEYANGSWFAAREEKCEQILAAFFRCTSQVAFAPIL
jgi:hypothetical protein